MPDGVCLGDLHQLRDKPDRAEKSLRLEALLVVGQPN